MLKVWFNAFLAVAFSLFALMFGMGWKEPSLVFSVVVCLSVACSCAADALDASTERKRKALR